MTKKDFPPTFQSSEKRWKRVGKSRKNDGKSRNPFGRFLGKLELNSDGAGEDGSEQKGYLVADDTFTVKGGIDV